MSRLPRLLLRQSVALAVIAMLAASADARPVLSTVEVQQAADHDGRKLSGQRRDPAPRAQTGVQIKTAPAKSALSVAGTAIMSASFKFSGTAGDWISGGRAYSYVHPTQALSMQTTIWDRGPHVTVSVKSEATNEYWTLDLEAPSGADLAVGRYENATRFPFNPSNGAGLTLSGTGRGCNESLGYFEIHQIVIGTGRQVEALDATFAQNCEKGTTFAYGHVMVNASALTHTPAIVSFDADADGTVAARRFATGFLNKLVVNGRFSCTGSVSIAIAGEVRQTTLTQPVKAVSSHCGAATGVSWRADESATRQQSFQPGAAEARTVVTAYDAYDVIVASPVTLTDTTTLAGGAWPTQTAVSSARARLGGDSWLVSKPGHSYATPGDQAEGWSDGTYLYLRINGADGKKWAVYFATVGAAKLAAGKYGNTSRIDFGAVVNSPGKPALTVQRDDKPECDSATGSFEVHQISYQPDGTLSGLDATFEHHCNGGLAVTLGHVLINKTALKTFPAIAGGAHYFEAFRHRTVYGMNTGGTVYGSFQCPVATTFTVIGKVTQGYAAVPLKGTLNCTTSEVDWTAFGTQLQSEGFYDGQSTVELTLAVDDAYLRAYQTTLTNVVQTQVAPIR